MIFIKLIKHSLGQSDQLKCISVGSIDSKSALVQVMTYK